ncbi:MAG: hypothetical protein SFT92_10160 [Rickettsiales bacterium]|nr:hypothetical protein [Rickettsiales bacterium]
MRALIESYTQSDRPFWLALLVLIGAALFINVSSYVSIDNGWLLLATERWLAGDTLYRDLMETNPPLIIWLYSLPVHVGAWLGVASTHVFIIFVLILLVASLLLARAQLAKHALLVPHAYANTLLIALALIVFSCASPVFGQREHLWVLLIAPYLFQSLALRSEPRQSWEQFLVASLAALGFALKPFFIVVLVANELYLAFYNRRLSWLWRRTNLVITAWGLAYIAAVATYFPEYFTRIIPLLLATYDYYKLPAWEVWKATLIVSVFYVPAGLFVRATPELKPISYQLLLLYAAGCAVQIIQQKGWYNHYYAMFFFGSLLVSVTFIRQLRAQIIKREMPGRLTFAALCCCAFMIVLPPIAEPIRLWDPIGGNKILSQIEEAIEQRAAGKNIMVFSYNLQSAFPLRNYSYGHYVGRFNHLCPMPAVAYAKPEKLTPEQAKQIAEIKAYLLQSVTEDMERFKPALVVVDRGAETEEPKGIGFIAFFSQDKRFAKLWKSYVKYKDVDVPPHNALEASVETTKHELPLYTIYIRK